MPANDVNWTMEIVRTEPPQTKFKAAILDFDGTLSLIREGWQNIMVPYFIEVLRATPKGGDEPDLEAHVREFVYFLNGKQTIYQCIRLSEETAKRGGTPLEPLEYKHEYLRRLQERIQCRIDALENGTNRPEDHLVHGSIALLEMMRKNGLKLYLASGTDEKYVKQEAKLLGLADYFDGGIFGAQDDYKLFSKAMIIRKIIESHELEGPELLGFGDGYVEIENVRDTGGYPIGVASNEAERRGIDAWKRARLIRAGAALIIPDYSDCEKLEEFLFNKT